MSEYIRRSDALALAREYYSQGLKEEAVPIKAIKNIPSADVVDLNDLEKGCFYGVGTDGVFYKLYPRIKLPLAKKINVETGEIIYPTNADRFRAKSDEELAKTISGDQIYPWCAEEEPCKYDSCTDCVLAWLKQEVSNDK